MKRLFISILVVLLSLSVLVGCSSPADNTDNTAKEEKKVTFGITTWSSTLAPTAIAKMILEEGGYEVETVLLDQPIIFQGLSNKQVDFFMDAWLPYTEAALWDKHGDELEKVALSYANAPLGWVVPTYVEENSIEELNANAEKYNNELITMDPGAGIVTLSKEVIEVYDLDKIDLVTSSEVAMLTAAANKMSRKEPVVFTGWRPHSMFAMYDLKFLEDPKEVFKYDDIYVLSYKGIQEAHPEAYSIMSQWSIEVSDLEVMMLENSENETPFEDTAKEWIKNNRAQVDKMLGK